MNWIGVATSVSGNRWEGQGVTLTKTGRTVGRPPLNRALWRAMPYLETTLVTRLTRQGASVDVKLLPYMDLILATVHNYSGPYLPDVRSLPTVVDADTLRKQAAQLTPAHGALIKGLAVQRKSLKTDEELGKRIVARSRDLGVGYSDYLRLVFSLAAGFDRSAPYHVHPTLPMANVG